jgi:hypothetical protein
MSVCHYVTVGVSHHILLFQWLDCRFGSVLSADIYIEIIEIDAHYYSTRDKQAKDNAPNAKVASPLPWIAGATL